MIHPKPLLSEYIVGYDVFEIDHHIGNYYKPLPSGYPEFVFHYGAPLVNAHINQPTSRFFVTFDTKVIDGVCLISNEPIRSISALIHPHALVNIFNINHSLKEHFIIDLEPSLKEDPDVLIKKIINAKTKQEKVSFIEKEIYDYLTENPQTIDPVSKSIFYNIYENRYCSSDLLSHKLNISKKTINRRFLYNLGITLNDYLRIVRFNMAFRMLDKDPKTNFNDIVTFCNYYDKQHFLKEFKFFTGKTTSEIFEKRDYLLLNRVFLKVE